MAVKNKKVAAGVGIAAAAAAVLALGAGTFASFSATQNGPAGTIAAGTLQFGQLAPGAINVAALAPGESSAPQTLSYSNAGTESGTLAITFSSLVNIEDGCRGDEALFEPAGQTCDANATSGDLSPLLNVRVTSGAVNGALVYDGPVNLLVPSTTADSPITVGPGGTADYVFVFTFPNGGPGDNIAQGDTISIETEARLDQVIAP